jgi:hypothetical protein
MHAFFAPPPKKNLPAGPFGAPRLVLGIGPGRVSLAQVHRASCQTGSGQESPNIFWAVPCQPEV